MTSFLPSIPKTPHDMGHPHARVEGGPRAPFYHTSGITRLFHRVARASTPAKLMTI
jgi:hypothetical protein